MSLQIIVKNSSVSGREPTASQLANGELALNYHADGPFITCKDTNGVVRRITGVWIGVAAPGTPQPGELWLDTTTTPAVLKVYKDGTDTWVAGTTVGAATTTSAGIVELATNAETQTGSDTTRAVTPASLQSKVSDSTSTTSSTTIASSSAVKSAYDLANNALPKAGGRVTGALEIGPTGSLVFEGATDDAFELTLTTEDPTADRTITLPNVSGTVITTGDTGTVTNTMLAGSIADTKLSTISTAGKVSNSATTATSANTASAIVARDASGNFTAGTITAASFIPTSSTVPTNGVYLPAANSVGISTNGAGRLFVGSDGSVGIGGAAAATVPLDITDTGNGIRIKNAASGNYAIGLLAGTSSQDAYIYQRANAPLIFGTNNNERLRITSAGLVGIGITGPQSLLNISTGTTSGAQDVLTLGTAATGVNGSQALYLGAYGSNQYGCKVRAIYDYAATTGTSLAFETTPGGGGSPTERLRITSAGLVGVGTSAPTARLQVGAGSADGINLDFNGTIATGSEYSTLRFTASAYGFTGSEIRGIHTNGGINLGVLAFHTSGSERVRVTDTGLVGVGTSSPGARLESYTAGTANLRLNGSLVGGNTVDFYNFIPAVSNAGFAIQLGGTTRAAIDSLGRFGLGTSSPNARLHIIQDSTFSTESSAGIAISDGTSDVGLLMGTDATNNIAYIQSLDPGTSYVTRNLCLNPNGSLVGIGTTSPGSALDVTGDIRFTGSASTSGSNFIYSYAGGAAGAVRSGFYLDGTNTVLAFYTAQAERFRVDGSGRLLVGTSSAAGRSDLLQIQGESGLATGIGSISLRRGFAPGDLGSGSPLGRIDFGPNDGGTGARIEAVGDAAMGTNDYPSRLVFSTCPDSGSSPVERMRINNSGSVLINATANNGQLAVYSNIPAHPAQRCALFAGNAAGDLTMEAIGIVKFDNNSTTSQVFQRFYINNGVNGCGQINANGSGAAAFGTFSDARLKDNIVDLPSQLENIKNLRPVEFDYKDGSGHQIGFIAQEMQDVYPSAVSQNKDEMLMITGWGKTEACLVKALQEAVAKIETLEAKVTALEGA